MIHFHSSYKNTHVYQISSLQVKSAFIVTKTKFSKNFGQKKSSKAFLWPETSFFNRFKNFLFEVGDIEYMNNILSPLALLGAEIFWVVQCPPPPVPHKTTYRLVLKGLRNDILKKSTLEVFWCLLIFPQIFFDLPLLLDISH